jgi:hypothetical protein
MDAVVLDPDGNVYREVKKETIMINDNKTKEFTKQMSPKVECSDEYGNYTYQINFTDKWGNLIATFKPVSLMEKCALVDIIKIISDKESYYTNETATFQTTVRNDGNFNFTEADKFLLAISIADKATEYQSEHLNSTLSIMQEKTFTTKSALSTFKDAEYSFNAETLYNGAVMDSDKHQFNVHAKPIILKVIGANFELLTFLLILSLIPIIYLIYKSLYPLQITEIVGEIIKESASVEFKVQNVGLVNLGRVQLRYTFDFNKMDLSNISVKPVSKIRKDKKGQTTITYTWELPLKVTEMEKFKFIVDKIDPHVKIPNIKARILPEQ